MSKQLFLRGLGVGAVVAAMTGCGALAKAPWAGTPQQATLRRAAQADAPRWVKDAVFYQIFPERFANGSTANDPAGALPWGGKPENFNFFGGDLAGIRQRLDHLQDLGVTALYLNPIFASPSNHKYNTSDYMQIDPAFGTMADFDALVRDLKKRGMHLILDGVFNHTGDKHAAFADAAARGPSSPTWSWYTIYGFPVVNQPKPNYDAWWGFGELPKLNYSNPQVPAYVLDKVVDFWTRKGIDGWRLDVPNEVALPGFWEAFRRKVRSINPGAYIAGEIWDDPGPWIQGDKFDATMNYPFRGDVLAFVNHAQDVDRLDWNLAGQRARQEKATNGMFNILGSHDVERLRTLVQGDPWRHREAALIQMTYPGAPVIYYGDEIGMTGGKDPDNRKCFDWNRANWDLETYHWYRKLIAARKRHPALRDGWFQPVLKHNDRNLYAYLREKAGDRVWVAVNNAFAAQDVVLPLGDAPPADGTVLVDELGGGRYLVRGGQVVIPALDHGGAVLAPERSK